MTDYAPPPLVACCADSNLAGARYWLSAPLQSIYLHTDAGVPAAQLEARKDALLCELFRTGRDGEEETPVEAVVRAGSSCAAATTTRLFLLECLQACGPLDRFADQHDAYVERLTKGLKRPPALPRMQQQVMLFWIKLGALERPYNLGDAGVVELGREERKVHLARRAFWLDCLDDIDHSGIALCVANGFHREFDEMKAVYDEFNGGVDDDADDEAARATAKQRRASLPRDFPNDRPRRIGEALKVTLQLAEDAKTLVSRSRVSNPGLSHGALRKTGDRVPVAAGRSARARVPALRRREAPRARAAARARRGDVPRRPRRRRHAPTGDARERRGGDARGHLHEHAHLPLARGRAGRRAPRVARRAPVYAPRRAAGGRRRRRDHSAPQGH